MLRQLNLQDRPPTALREPHLPPPERYSGEPEARTLFMGWDRDSPICQSVDAFTEALRRTFDNTIPSKEASRQLISVSQGTQTVAEYAVAFRTAARSKWIDNALIDAFYEGLSPILKDEMATRELSRGVGGAHHPCDQSQLAHLGATRLPIQRQPHPRFRLIFRSPTSTQAPDPGPPLLTFL